MVYQLQEMVAKFFFMNHFSKLAKDNPDSRDSGSL